MAFFGMRAIACMQDLLRLIKHSTGLGLSSMFLLHGSILIDRGPICHAINTTAMDYFSGIEMKSAVHMCMYLIPCIKLQVKWKNDILQTGIPLTSGHRMKGLKIKAYFIT